MRLLVIAGMIDEKLRSKLLPIQTLAEVTSIDLVRRRPYAGTKIRCFSPPWPINGWRPVAELWRILTIFMLLLLRRPKLLIALGVVPHGIYAWMFGSLFGVPVIQHVMGKNDVRLTFPGQWGRSLTLGAVKGAEGVAVRGQATKAWLIDQGADEARIFVPQNVHDFDLFRPLDEGGAVYDLIYVGLLARYKRIDLMLDVLARVRRTRAATLLLVGDGPERPALQRQAQNLGLADAVTFAGERPMEDLPALFSKARVFIMTSQGDGLPMAMIEAMSCGLPAVVPLDADIGEVARHDVNALVVQGGDAEAFSDAVLKALTDQALFERLRRGAMAIRTERAKEYSLAFQTALWQEAIARILKGQAR